MTREDRIRTLVDFSVAAAATDTQTGWLPEIFRKGFRGFASMSDDELLRELQFRGLADFEDQMEDEDFDDDTDAPRVRRLVGADREIELEDAELG